MTKYLQSVLLSFKGIYRLLIFLLLWLSGFQVLAIPCPIFTVSGGGTISAGQSASVTLTGAAVIGSSGFDLYRDGVLVTGTSGVASTSNGNVVWTVSQAGTYTVKSSDPCFVTMTGQAVVTINTTPPPTPPTITRVVNGTGCRVGVDTPVELQAIGGAGTYNWYDLAGNWKASTTTTTNTGTWTTEINMETSYRVTVTNANGTSAAVVVTAYLYTPPSASISSSGSTTICLGQTVTLTASAGVSYRWSTGATTQAITVSASGNYSVTITQQYGCQVTSAAVAVTVKPLPSTIITQSGSVVAFGQGSEISLSVPACSGCSYQWSYSLDGSTNWVNASTSSVTPVEKSGYYRVAVTSNGCTSLSAAFGKVTVNDYNYIITNSIQKAGIKTQIQLNALTVGNIEQSITYFDGLGRPMQSVITQGSPGGKDIVQPVQYDEFSRNAIKYLPYTDGNTGSYKTDAIAKNSPLVDPTAYSATKQYQFYQSAPGVVYDTKPFAQSLYEASPLDRIKEQGAAGKDWQLTDQANWPMNTNPSTKIVTRGNRQVSLASATAADDNVRLFSYVYGANNVFGTVSSKGFYGAGQLYVTETYNENGYKTIEFRNKGNLLILKKVQQSAATAPTTFPFNDTNYALTYYVYGNHNRLHMVIQPEGSASLTTIDANLDNIFIGRYCFTYYYDAKGRTIEKLTPGGGKTYVVYNKRDEEILSQDAKQRAANQWTFKKYNALGRLVLTGIYTHCSALSQVDMQKFADGAIGCVVTQAPTYTQFETHTTTNAAYFGYTNTAFPTLNTQLLTVSFYDDYDFNNDGNPDVAYLPSLLVPEPIPFYRSNSKLTGTKTRVLGTTSASPYTNDYLTTISFYDKEGRGIQTQSDNYIGGVLGGKEVSTSVYDDLSGRVMQSKIVQTAKTELAIPAVTIKKKFLYNPYSKHLSEVYQQNQTGASPPDVEEQLALNRYNELGELLQKEVGVLASPQKSLQTIDYQYNILGWLTKVNDADLTKASTENDLFGFELFYNSGTDLSNKALVAQFNGNIVGQKWQSKLDGVKRMFSYTYDPESRLKKSLYEAYLGTTKQSENFSTTGFDLVNATIETGILYDKNGNIRSLGQYGLTYRTNSTDAIYGLVDNLKYDYVDANRNQLLKVQDRVVQNMQGPAKDFFDGANTATEYGFDASGNMNRDDNKKILSITYNHLNLPTYIDFGNSKNIQNTYNASGIKLRSIVSYGGSPVTTKTTDYAGGFVYVEKELEFFGNEEGRVVSSKFTSGTSGFTYEYHYKDQVGNTRMAFRKGNSTPYRVSMEPSEPTKTNEERAWANVATTRNTDELAGRVYRTGSYAARLNRDRVLGPWKQIQLNQGDQFSATAYVAFKDAPTRTEKNLKDYLITVGTGASSPANSGGAESRNIISVLSVGIQAPLNTQPTANANAPRAYLKYMFYDKSGALIKEQSRSAPATANISTNGSWQPLTLNFTAPQDGYVQVFVANEDEKPAWFDDIEVTVAGTMIVQENHYAAFGLELEGIDKTGTPDHRRKFNGIEKNDELGLGVYEASFRVMDPQLGRWWQVDPEVNGFESLTPYNNNENNPITNTDPDGNCPWCIAFVKGAAQDYGTQVIGNLIEGKSLKQSLTDVNVNQILISGATDAVTLGLGSLLKGAKVVNKIANKLDDVADAGKKIVGRSDDVGKKLVKSCGCFTANTLVLTDKGRKRIEEIKVGDKVWAYSDKTGKLAVKKVTHTFVYERDSVYHIYVGKDKIEATSDHPFFIGGKWLRVSQLRQGQLLKLYSGKKASIDSIAILPIHTKVYNFTVDEFHTYYVSARDVLVHNNGPCKLKVGNYKELAKVGDDATPDHIPSFAAVKLSKEQKLGRKLTKVEESQLYKETTTTLQIPSSVHKSSSETYAGRNSASKIAQDAADLYKAAKSNMKALGKALKDAGYSNEEIKKAFAQVHARNKKNGIY